MQRVTDRLYIGGQQDNPPDDSWAVVRAAKSPWHLELVGKVKPDHPDYLTKQDGQVLTMNLIDPPLPLFKRVSFERFLAFMAEQWQAGRKVLITCNQGKSRAPSLALLFAAKGLGLIPDTSYDDAWDAFEQLVGEYSPGKGIETYLRANWQEIQAVPVAFIEGAATEPVPQQADIGNPITLAPSSPVDSLRMIYRSPFVHFYAAARITDKDGVLTPPDMHIVPNVFQQRACEAYEWCLANNVPIRLVLGPKPRQSGGSTISAELCLHHTQRFHTSGMMIGDENDRTDLIWAMFHKMADNDRFKGIWKTRHTYNTEKGYFFYEDEQGQEQGAEWLRDTANDPKAGASGTRQILWCSEAGRYSKEGKVTDTQVISNAISSVPEKPGTMVILESTAEGSSGYFFRTVKGAVTLEERMQGRVGNGWIKVSCWWHECPDYFLPRSAANEDWFSGPLDEREKRGVELYSWTAEQIAWRRSKIKGQFDGNEQLFDQEFPESEDVAFQSSGNPRFCIAGMTRLEKLAIIGHDAAELGALEENDGRLTFIPAHERPWLWVKERPMYHASYILSADCMTGVQSAGSKKRDEHAICVWRAPYKDPNNHFHGAKLVAAIHVRGGCRWDEDVLARRIRRLSKWYGNCIIGIEVNEAFGVLRDLINAGANLWKRDKADEASGIAGMTLKIPGWKTTTATRSILVKDIAAFVREQEGEVHFKPFVDQLRTFVQHEDGSCSAKEGSHDDWILSGAIGLTLMHTATPNLPPAAVLPTAHAPDQAGGFRHKGSGAVG